MRDRELVERFLAGESEAFHDLVEKYQEPVYRVAWRFLGNHHDALEISQETFARAFEKLATFDLARKFSVWLMSVAANYSRDVLRRRGRRPEILDDERLARTPGGGSPDGEAVRQEEAERLREAVSTLDDDKRLAVLLRYFEGLSLKEVAEVTGEGESTLKVRLFLARKEIMRKLLE